VRQRGYQVLRALVYAYLGAAALAFLVREILSLDQPEVAIAAGLGALGGLWLFSDDIREGKEQAKD
jgi:hypothetical protein